MNELYFLAQVSLIILFSYGALRFGKSALIASIALQAILANLFVLKQMTFFGFTITCSDAFAIGSILGLNLLREYFGKDAAKKAMSICFFFMVFFVVMTQMHLRFIPSPYDTAHFAYTKVLGPAPRLLIASLITFYLIQRLELHLFGWISRILPKSKFTTRNALSLSVSQLADTLLFSFIGLFGILPKLGHIILISFLVKALIVFLIAPMIALMHRFSWDRTDAF